jgi:hypothetical protein
MLEEIEGKQICTRMSSMARNGAGRVAGVGNCTAMKGRARVLEHWSCTANRELGRHPAARAHSHTHGRTETWHQARALSDASSPALASDSDILGASGRKWKGGLSNLSIS